MKRPKVLPPGLGAAPFAVTHAIRNGVGRSRLRKPDLEAPFHGIRDRRSDEQPGLEPWQRSRDRAMGLARAYLIKLPATAFFTHLTAAHIHGLPVPARLDCSAGVHVGTIAQERRRRGRAVHGHLMAPTEVAVQLRQGLPVSAAVDVWCQLAQELTVDELVIMGDALVRRNSPLATMAELETAVRRRAGRRGIRKLREALERVRPRTDSVRETELRLAIVRAGLPEPEVNVVLYDVDGVFIGFFDLAHPKYKIVTEYDGDQHREDAGQYHHDVNRLDQAMEAGWRIIRANKEHVPDGFAMTIARLRTALRARGWRS